MLPSMFTPSTAEINLCSLGLLRIMKNASLDYENQKVLLLKF